MLNKAQENLINICIILFKNSILNNIKAQDLLFSEFSHLPFYLRLQTKIKETEEIQEKINKVIVDKTSPVFTQREKIIFINILQTVIRQVESMSLIFPAGNVEIESISYNQKISEVIKDIKDLLLLLKNSKVI